MVTTSVKKKSLFEHREPDKKMISKTSCFRCAVIAILLWTASATNSTHATTIDFESFNDNTSLADQITGISFTDATVFTAGVSLNEFDFPPSSGMNVVASGLAGAGSGILSMTFDTAMSKVGGFFTFADQLSLQAFDLNHNLLGSTQSVASNVLGSWEDLSISLSGISYLTITGASQFTLDDLTFEAQPVPEPATLLLFASGVLMYAVARKKGKLRSVEACTV